VPWIGLVDGRMADSRSGGEWRAVEDCVWLIRSIWRIEPGKRSPNVIDPLALLGHVNGRWLPSTTNGVPAVA
jgi:hypothetical protein